MAHTEKLNNDPHPAADAGGDSVRDRQKVLEQLFISAWSDLQASAYVAYPNLMVFDCDQILSTVADRLQHYDEEVSSTAFLKWAGELVMREAKRFRLTSEILTEHESMIRSAIRRAMLSAAVDAAVDENDLFAEVAMLIFEKANELNAPGSAKQSSRVFALARRHTLSYHTRKTANRLRILEQRPELLEMSGCETLSKLEIEADRAAEMAAQWN